MDNQETENFIEKYLKEQKQALEYFPIQETAMAIERIWDTYQRNGTVYSCGNGGTTGAVSNLITDLAMHTFMGENKSEPLPENIPRLKCIDLCLSSGAITASMNDLGPEYIFSQQLENYAVNENDLLIGYSGSGNSKNVVKAFEKIRSVGGQTIAITRNKEGKIVQMADVPIVFDFKEPSQFPGQQGKNDNNFYFEDFGFSIGHIFTGIIKERIKRKNESWGTK